MYRSLLLIFVFLLFSVAMPCLCMDEGMIFSMTDGICVDPVVASGGYMSGAAGCMNVFDHAASWRAFLSSSVPAVFFLLGVVLLFAVVSRFRLTAISCLFEFRSVLLHPPEYFDRRVLLSGSLYRALYRGVVHAKVS